MKRLGENPTARGLAASPLLNNPTQSGHRSGRVSCGATGSSPGLVREAERGAVLDERPRSLLLQHAVANLRWLAEPEEYFLRLCWFLLGTRREFDFPDLLASLAPRRCWLLNAAAVHRETLAESTMESL